MKGIGERLREIRIKLGYKEQKEFANSFPQEVSVTQMKISRYENETNKINSDFLESLGEYFHVNIHWLVTGQGKMFVDENQIKNEENEPNNNSNESDNFTNHIINDFKMLDKKSQKAIHLEILTKLREEGKI